MLLLRQVPRRRLATRADETAEALAQRLRSAGQADSAFYTRLVQTMDREQTKALTAALMQNPEAGPEAAFKRADRDRDGVISKHEFHKWFESEHRPLFAQNTAASTAQPSTRQLFYFALASAVPFLGFGFMDNFGMIVFGEYIDSTLGVALGLSTMMAAGLGNTVADVVGISFGQTIELISSRLGLPDPKLTDAQRRMTQARWARGLGTSIGLGTGCLLGLVPLFFIERHRKKKELEEGKRHSTIKEH